MLLAPVLAVTLAFLLAGAVSFLPQTASQSQPSPQPTSNPNTTLIPLPSTAPVAQSSQKSDVVPILFVVGAVVVGIAAALLLFSEKNLTKEISS